VNAQKRPQFKLLNHVMI